MKRAAFAFWANIEAANKAEAYNQKHSSLRPTQKSNRLQKPNTIQRKSSETLSIKLKEDDPIPSKNVVEPNHCEERVEFGDTIETPTSEAYFTPNQRAFMDSLQTVSSHEKKPECTQLSKSNVQIAAQLDSTLPTTQSTLHDNEIQQTLSTPHQLQDTPPSHSQVKFEKATPPRNLHQLCTKNRTTSIIEICSPTSTIDVHSPEPEVDWTPKLRQKQVVRKSVVIKLLESDKLLLQKQIDKNWSSTSSDSTTSLSSTPLRRMKSSMVVQSDLSSSFETPRSVYGTELDEMFTNDESTEVREMYPPNIKQRRNGFFLKISNTFTSRNKINIKFIQKIKIISCSRY
ncbi:hypothetical protein AKO1_006423 [Acrasis kona]|uniref:Uncharacterized protein n=1 Tax=Acrasis kona TaxID=1008807 RepID=A0AAW2YI68_9EUKA